MANTSNSRSCLVALAMRRRAWWQRLARMWNKSWIGKAVATIPSFSMNDYAMLGEEVIAPAAALGEYPANLSAAEGAAVWMQYLTAYGALVAIAHLARRFCGDPCCVEQCGYCRDGDCEN